MELFLSANQWHFKIKFLRNLYFGSAVVANSLPELIICNTKCFLTGVKRIPCYSKQKTRSEPTILVYLPVVKALY